MYSLFCTFAVHIEQNSLGQNFLLDDLRDFFFRFRVGGRKNINKKALKMTRAFFNFFFLIFSELFFIFFLQKQ